MDDRKRMLRKVPRMRDVTNEVDIIIPGVMVQKWGEKEFQLVDARGHNPIPIGGVHRDAVGAVRVIRSFVTRHSIPTAEEVDRAIRAISGARREIEAVPVKVKPPAPTQDELERNAREQGYDNVYAYPRFRNIYYLRTARGYFRPARWDDYSHQLVPVGREFADVHRLQSILDTSMDRADFLHQMYRLSALPGVAPTAEDRVLLEKGKRQERKRRKAEKRVAERRRNEDAEDAQKRRTERYKALKPSVVMLNPKTLELVEMHQNKDGYWLSFFGDPESCIGSSYSGGNSDVDGETYTRIHSPGGCSNRLPSVDGVSRQYKGQGYGMLLYAGTAATVYLRDKHSLGVYSIEGSRSYDADELWKKMIKSDIAEEVTGEGSETEEEEEEHCEDISDSTVEPTRRNGHRYGTILDSQVCANVTVEYKGSEETYTIIDGQKVLKLPFVLWAEKGEGEVPEDRQVVPSDILVRIKVKDRTAAEKLGEIIRERHGEELYLAFMQRPDILEMYGQGRLPGLEAAGKGLPPLSSESKHLLEKWAEVSDGDGDVLEGPRPAVSRRRRGEAARATSSRGTLVAAGGGLGDVFGLSAPRSRQEIMVERSRLWRQRERAAFHTEAPGARHGGTSYDAKQVQALDKLIEALDRELDATTSKPLGDYDRNSAKIAIFFGAAAFLVGGIVFLMTRKRLMPLSNWPGWISPIAGGEVLSGWGDARSGGRSHEGIDFRVPVGTPVLVVADGVVNNAFTAPDGLAGMMIEVDHPGGLRSRYLHLSQFGVAPGQAVRQGETIGLSGDTGNAAGDPQLHFDVRVTSQDGLNNYTVTYGTPINGFPEHTDGWAVPAEPMGPWLLSSAVVVNATSRGVALAA